MTGQLKCQKHHIMLKVARDLWYCDQCDYFTGGMQHLKGVCDEVRRLVKAAGGMSMLRATNKAANKRKRDNAKELKLTRKEINDKHGYYDPVTYFRTATGAVRCKDCGGDHGPDVAHRPDTSAKRDSTHKEQTRKLA